MSNLSRLNKYDSGNYKATLQQLDRQGKILLLTAFTATGEKALRTVIKDVIHKIQELVGSSTPDEALASALGDMMIDLNDRIRIWRNYSELHTTALLSCPECHFRVEIEGTIQPEEV